MRGPSLEDKLYAVKYIISGQALSFVLLKATTSQPSGPKKKHLTYLVSLTNEPNVSIPRMAKCLMQRARHPEWQVAFKALITMHHLMTYGNQRLVQNLASSTVYHRTFDRLSGFVDRRDASAREMSTFVRRYSRYIYTKVNTYRSLGTDFCKFSPTQPELAFSSPLLKIRGVSVDKLSSLLAYLQNLFDILMAFDASPGDLSNGIMEAAFGTLYRDFVKLYIAYQSAIIHLLDLYFSIRHVRRIQELLELYKRFLVRMDKVSDFMRVVDVTSVDKSDMPTMSRAPSLSLKALEAHLRQLESSASRRIYEPPARMAPALPEHLGSPAARTRRRNWPSCDASETAEEAPPAALAQPAADLITMSDGEEEQEEAAAAQIAD